MQRTRHGQDGASPLISVFDGHEQEGATVKRHWSFVVCDKKYLYPLVAILLLAGLTAALALRDPVQFNRVGNFIIGTGVWMSMRYTLREGLERYKNLSDSLPTLPVANHPGVSEVNAAFFNRLAFTIGDAQLQVHGFVLVMLGSAVGSYGDAILRYLLPAHF